MNIIEYVQNRLNLKIELNKFNQKLNYKTVSKFFEKNDFDNCFVIPKTLYNDISEIILNEYKDCSKTKIKNRLEIALYIVIIIYHNMFKDDETIKKCFSSGVQISKEIFSSVLSNIHLYELKKILFDNKIIEYKTYEKLNKFYSKKNGLAIKYCLNIKYITDSNFICVENKYVLKFISLYKNGLLYGTKKLSLNDAFLPFNDFEKNVQYIYQKNMFFDEAHFNKVLNKKYPNKNDLLNGDDCDEKINLIKLLNCYQSLNSHIFKSSESYGRIYMPFQYVQSDFRECIRIGNNENIIEAFDIKCCFVFLTAKIFYELNLSDELNYECKTIIEKCNDDIYKDILKYNKTSYKNENRKKIKASVMKWLFSNRKDRFISIKMSNDVYLIDNYFKNKYPLFYKNVVFYKESQFYKEIDGKVIKEAKSELSFECFKMESKIMFNNVLPYLHEKYKNIPFISLHDAIFIPKKFETFIKNIQDDIYLIMKEE